MWTLRNRLVLVNVVVFLLAFLVLASVLTGQLLGHLYEQLDQELANAATRAFAEVVMVDGRPRLHEAAEHLPPELGDKSFVRLLDPQGKLIAGAGTLQDFPVAPATFSVPVRGGAFNDHAVGGVEMRVYTRPIYASFAAKHNVLVGYAQAASAPEEILEFVDQLRRSLLIATLLALLVAGLAAFLAAGKALQPLTTMTHSAAAISADSLNDRRLPVPKPKDELQALALAFNATLDRLSGAFTRQRRFTADASHELRTPVTAILGQAELALSRNRTSEAYQETLVRIQGEAERMQRLIGRLLTLARAEGGQLFQTFALTDVAALLNSLTDTMASQLENKPVRLELHTPPAATIVTDADSLTQVLVNLLDNAIAYTDEGGIDVTLTVQADGVCIQISDSGPGIDPQHLDLIFEPFYRADPSRQRQSGGVGLGLALAAELTHLLGGQITAANRTEGGAVFSLTLPLHPPGASN